MEDEQRYGDGGGYGDETGTNVKCWFHNLISVEAGVVNDPQKAGDRNGSEAVVLSFGTEDSEILDLAISTNDAWHMIAGLLSALAEHGHEMAVEIGDQYFSPETAGENEGEHERE